MSYIKECRPSFVARLVTALLEFTGHKLSQKQKALITKATAITLGSLVSKRLAESLEITIEINRNLFKETGTLGNCGLEDDARSPKYFIIELNYGGANTMDELIQTLCHELVHVAQYAQRRMRCLSGSYAVAWGKDHYNTQDIAYDDRPWEIEAFELEEMLYSKVKKTLNEENNARIYA